MMKLEWNALRVGDKVLVHDATDPDCRSCRDRCLVQTMSGSNDIGVRSTAVAMTSFGPAACVHLDPLDLAEECWRCDAIARRARRDAAASAP